MVERARINGIDLHYQDVGEGPPVVFLHGAGGNHVSWWQQTAHFADDHRCLVPDQRMYGFSADESDGPGVEAFVDDLGALLDHCGVERAALVAQSMGGWTAAGFASEHPDRVAALVLADTPAGIVDIDPDATEDADDPEADDEALDLTLAYSDALAPEKQFLYQSISGLNRHTPEGVVADLATLDVDPDPIVENDLPVLVLAGEDDALTPVPLVEAVHERLPGSEFVTVPDSGHSIYFERPGEFNRLVGEFLREAGHA
jgi:3-oxoadipate enol-lactonase